MIKQKLMAFCIVMLCMATFVSAQTAPELDLQIIKRNIETVYVSDLDILQLASADEFFRITIRFGDREYDNCRLELTFSKDDELLARIVSKPFTIPAAGQDGVQKSASNVDLMEDRFYLKDAPQPGSNYLIEIEDSDLSTDNIDNIERDLLSSGKLPVGHYVLEGTLEGNEFTANSDYDEFDITNPSFVELLSPGSEAGSGFAEQIYYEYPVFQWNGNGDEYQVVVFEKKYALQSLDNILNMFPNWKSERTNNFSIQYPQVGEKSNTVIPLEYGKTYYWMVRMFVQTSAGEEDINSEIWQFDLVDPTTLGDEQAEIARNQLIEFLRDMIGDQADEIAKQLADYDVKSIQVNGQEITIEDLYQLINEYRLKQVEVVDLIPPTGSY